MQPTGLHLRAPLAVERLYEDLLDLEQLVTRFAEGDPLVGEKGLRLLADWGKLIDRMADGLVPHASSGGENTDSRGMVRDTGQNSDLSFLNYVLTSRKGRVLVCRFLVCLAPPPNTSHELFGADVKDHTHSIMWQLLRALLRTLPGAPPDLTEDSSWRQLWVSLARAMEAACADDRPGRPSQSVSALAILVVEQGCRRVEPLCSSRAGVFLLRQLVEGCAGHHGPSGTSVEEMLLALMSKVFSMYPELITVAARGVPGSAAGGTAEPDFLKAKPVLDANRPNQDELTAMLTSVMKQAKSQQERNAGALLNSEVDTSRGC